LAFLQPGAEPLHLVEEELKATPAPKVVVNQQEEQAALTELPQEAEET